MGIETTRRFGVELEGFVGDNIYGEQDINGCEWYVDDDGSLSGSGYDIEAKSPPLSNTEPIYEMYDWLNGYGWDVNDSAGLHIHVEVDDYEYKDFQKLLALMVGMEPYVYSVTNSYRFHGTYAKPITRDRGEVLSVLRRVNPWRIEDVLFASGRYRGLNFQSYREHGRKTVEFRYFYPQEEAAVVEAYIELVTKIVNFAKHATYEQVLVITNQLLDSSLRVEQAHEIICEVLQLEKSEELRNQMHRYVWDNYSKFTVSELDGICQAHAITLAV